MRMALRWDVLCSELRVLGLELLAIPALVASLFAIAIGMMAFKQAHQSDISNMVMVGIEGGLPLAASIVIATLAAQEPALELQLTMPTPYRLTVLRRFALVLGWTALIEAVIVAVLGVSFPWVLKRDGIGSLLMWLAPLLWMSAWAAILALLFRSRAASIAILGVVWVFELAFHGTVASYGWTQAADIFATLFNSHAAFWLPNRLALLVTALMLLIGIWLYLRNTEWRLRGEDQ